MNETTNLHADPLRAEGEQRVDAPANDATVRRPAPSRPLPDDALILLPVRNTVLFPGLVVPLAVGRERSRAAVQEAVRLQRPIGILLQSKPEVDEPGPEDLHWVGTTRHGGALHRRRRGQPPRDLPRAAALPRAAVPRGLSASPSRACS